MSTLGGELLKIRGEIENLLQSDHHRKACAMPANAFFMPCGRVLALPRDSGDSRYPLGHNGFNFWAYASGYMHGNEGLFSTFLRATDGAEPNIGFFAGLPTGHGKFSPLSLLSVPILRESWAMEVKRYSVLGQNAAYYLAELQDLQFGLRVFVTEEKEICFSIHVMNQSDEAQKFYLSSYLNPYLRNQIYESSEDKWFKEIRAMEPESSQGDLGSFLVSVHEDKSRTETITHWGVLQRSLHLGEGAKLLDQESTCSRYQYVGGSRSSLHAPKSLTEGTFNGAHDMCTFIETAIMGDLVHLELPAHQDLRLDLVFSCPSSEKAARKRAGEGVNARMLDAALDALDDAEQAKMSTLAIEVNDPVDDSFRPHVFNAFFSHLMKQVEFCSLLKGYIQLSHYSLIGIRDVYQALEGLLFWEPEAARTKMLEALGYTAPNGRCFRQYSLPTSTGQVGKMDLRPFIDQGSWVISCFWSYLKTTGDWKVLEESCGYHDILDEPSGQVAPSDHEDTVLEHLLKIMDYLLDNRDHYHTRCVLALYGDWNDALDGLGVSRDASKTYGTGVSVMATLHVYQNTLEMVELLGSIDPKKFEPYIQRYRLAAYEIAEGLRRYGVVENDKGERRLLHGWGDARSYLVGSYDDPDGQARDGLTSNAFWVLSRLFEQTPELRDTILSAFKRLDSKYGLKTFEPAFPEDTKGVGRITKLPAGTAENGASYIHATAFGIMALFQMGAPREGWDQLIKILPFTDIHENLSHSPFVMPNSYGFNEEKAIDGQNMNDWQTGSSNVVFKLLVRFVFGYEPCADGVWIQPAAWAPFKKFRFNIRAHGCDVSINYENEGADVRVFAVNGEARDPVLDEQMGIEKLWIPYEEFKEGKLDVRVRDLSSDGVTSDQSSDASSAA